MQSPFSKLSLNPFHGRRDHIAAVHVFAKFSKTNKNSSNFANIITGLRVLLQKTQTL